MDATAQSPVAGKRTKVPGSGSPAASGSKEEEDTVMAKVAPAPTLDASGMDIETALKFYYSHFFPYTEMCDWLSYGDSKYMYHREFSFTVGEVYMRYLSFRNEAELRARLKAVCPHKIDIGAVYTLPAAQHASVKKEAFHTEERELVFDIDLTDYDDVRTCCDGASICQRCWRLMTVAVKALDKGLREDFGFKHLLWVFSGRRGIHCWVCDKRARMLSDSERTAVVEYFTLVSGGSKESGTRIAVTHPLLPSQRRAFQELEDEFQRSVITRGNYERGVGILEDEKLWTKLLERVPNFNGLPAKLAKAFKGDHTALFRWRTLKKSVKDAAASLKARNLSKDQMIMRSRLRKCVPDIVFAYIYPRLDADVSKHQNHLLKSPFCVHPKTGKVCIPIDPDTVESFDPIKGVPTVYELAAMFAKTSDAEKARQLSSLQKHVDKFRSGFLAGLQRSALARKRRENEEQAAYTGDW